MQSRTWVTPPNKAGYHATITIVGGVMIIVPHMTKEPERG